MEVSLGRTLRKPTRMEGGLTGLGRGEAHPQYSCSQDLSWSYMELWSSNGPSMLSQIEVFVFLHRIVTSHVWIPRKGCNRRQSSSLSLRVIPGDTAESHEQQNFPAATLAYTRDLRGAHSIHSNIPHPSLPT